MRIIVDGQKILEKISLASRFVSNRFVTSSSLQGVLIKGDKEKMEIYSTNLNSYFQTTMKYKGEGSFTIVVDSKKIVEFLTLLQPGEIYIDIEEKKIIIGREKTRGTFSLYEAKDFPTPPKAKEKKEKIKTEVFKKLPMVIFAASQDISRPVLTAVNFITNENETKMVSTDGFRLSLLKTKKENKLPQALIPAETLTEAIRLVGEKDEVEIGYLEEEKMVVFYFGEDTLFTRLIEGEFPPFEKVIPGEKKTTIKLVKRVSSPK
jgi:DNA polymerase III subunit beta